MLYQTETETETILAVQEPGVYAVFVTAILQDATLSVKIASNMLEREVRETGLTFQPLSSHGFTLDFQCRLQRGSGGLCHSGLRLQGGTPAD